MSISAAVTPFQFTRPRGARRGGGNDLIALRRFNSRARAGRDGEGEFRGRA